MSQKKGSNPLEVLVAPDENTQMTVLIQKGCQFEGKLCFEGTARIDGRFKGQIYTTDILIVGEGALVEANIEADVVVIYGNVTGKITALNRIELKSTGVFLGDYCTPFFSQDLGGIHRGASQTVRDEDLKPQTKLFKQDSRASSISN